MFENQLARLSFVLTALLMLFQPALHAEELNAPQLLVKNATENLFQSLNESREELKTNPEKIYSMVEEILLPNFDFEKMTKLAMGKNWQKANEAQQQSLVSEFKLLLVRTYSTALLEYQGESLTMLPFRDDLSRKRVSVPTEIIQPAGPKIAMSLSLFENEQAEWKVYDIKIEGISLVSNYRSSFADEIRATGVDGLIADLAERNAKLKS